MMHAIALPRIPGIDRHGVAGQRLKSQWGHEPGRGFRHADHHIGAVSEQGHDLAPRHRAATDHQHAATAQVGEQGEQGGASDRGHAATLDGGSASGEMAGGFSLMLQTHKPCLEKASRIGILHRYISI